MIQAHLKAMWAEIPKQKEFIERKLTNALQDRSVVRRETGHERKFCQGIFIIVAVKSGETLDRA